jgi:CopZ-like zinc binding protein
VAGNSMERSGKEICMSKVCSAKSKIDTAPAVLACPVNGARSKQVDILTVKSLVRQLPLGMPDTQYYFCDAPDCEVVYFAQDSKAPTFLRKDLAVRVGAKEAAHPIPICYCFGFTRKDILDEICSTGKSTVAERIAEEVVSGRCACEVKNPSGKCCLGDVTRTANDMLKSVGEI